MNAGKKKAESGDAMLPPLEQMRQSLADKPKSCGNIHINTNALNKI